MRHELHEMMEALEGLTRAAELIERFEIRRHHHHHAMPVAKALTLTASEPFKRKPPPQIISVKSIVPPRVMEPSAVPVLTPNMARIAELVAKPEVRAYLAGAGMFKLPEQVQHARAMCERFVLAHCGAQDFTELAEGAPSRALVWLLDRIDNWRGG